MGCRNSTIVRKEVGSKEAIDMMPERCFTRYPMGMDFVPLTYSRDILEDYLLTGDDKLRMGAWDRFKEMKKRNG